MCEVLPSTNGKYTVSHHKSCQHGLKLMSVFKKMTLACLAVSAVAVSAQAMAAEEPIRHSAEFVYQKICLHCHEANANGLNVGPDIKGRGLPPVFTKMRVRQGWLAMPAFPASYISDETLDLLAEYIQNAPAPVATKNP